MKADRTAPIIVFVVAVLLAPVLVALTMHFRAVEKDRQSQVFVVVDDQTGCQYIHKRGIGSALTPRLDQDGQIICAARAAGRNYGR